MNPPSMAGWNLALRFGLELAALAGIAVLAWRIAPGALRWVAVVAAPAVAMTLWTVFNVPGDPSRSGEAPVTVPGAVRLVLELTILVGGAAAIALAASRTTGVVVFALIVVHYAASITRIEWLVDAA